MWNWDVLNSIEELAVGHAFNSDADPSLQFDADPDQTFLHLDASPDPDPPSYQSDAI
jgi:hypothetical protein